MFPWAKQWYVALRLMNTRTGALESGSVVVALNQEEELLDVVKDFLGKILN